MENIYKVKIKSSSGYVNVRFQSKNNNRDKGTLFNDKRPTHQEDTVILNVCTVNQRAAKRVKQKVIELEK